MLGVSLNNTYTFDATTKEYRCDVCAYLAKRKSKMVRHLSRKMPCATDANKPTHAFIPIVMVDGSQSEDQIDDSDIQSKVTIYKKAHPCSLRTDVCNKNYCYKCELCNKTFNKKDHYTIHINRQDPCVNSYSGVYRILKVKHIPKHQLNVLDLFCGCGGFAMGFTNAGYNIVAGIDFWDLAIKSYSQNFNHHAICADLTVLSPELFVEQYITKDSRITKTTPTCTASRSCNIQPIDVIIGGPPCQGFSTMGNRDPKDPRNSLFMEFVKYVYHFLPKAFVIENVVGILSMRTANNEDVIDIILSYMSLSYNCKVFKLSASDYDVPQERKRIFIIGIRKNLNSPPIVPTKPPETSKYNKIPLNSVLLLEDDIDSKHYLDNRTVLRINDSAKGKVYGVKFVDINKPCNTILAGYGKSGGYTSLIKYTEKSIRRLTILELKRIQTFPDDYILSGADNEKIKQIGNAVPCNLAYHIGIHIRKMIQKPNMQ